MRRIILVVFLFVFILLSCDDLIEIDDPYIKIEQIIPNPANLGDTVNIFLVNFNHPLNVESINQVKVRLFYESNEDTLQAIGFYDNLNQQEYGNFHHSDLTNSLSESYQQIVQCIVDSTYPTQSRVGIILNDITINSSKTLNVIK